MLHPKPTSRDGTAFDGECYPSMPNDLRPLLFQCPVTGVNVITGVLCDPGAPELLERVLLKCQCPVCGGVHATAVRAGGPSPHRRDPLRPEPLQTGAAPTSTRQPVDRPLQ